MALLKSIIHVIGTVTFCPYSCLISNMLPARIPPNEAARLLYSPLAITVFIAVIMSMVLWFIPPFFEVKCFVCLHTALPGFSGLIVERTTMPEEPETAQNRAIRANCSDRPPALSSSPEMVYIIDFLNKILKNKKVCLPSKDKNNSDNMV